MEQDKQQDLAMEPVDRNDNSDYMDTGVLHQGRVCTECGNDLATKGYRMCTKCLEKAGHDGR